MPSDTCLLTPKHVAFTPLILILVSTSFLAIAFIPDESIFMMFTISVVVCALQALLFLVILIAVKFEVPLLVCYSMTLQLIVLVVVLVLFLLELVACIKEKMCSQRVPRLLACGVMEMFSLISMGILSKFYVALYYGPSVNLSVMDLPSVPEDYPRR